VYKTGGKVRYLKRKETLINQKQNLRDKKARFKQKGLLWVEPLRDWVKTSDSAGKLNFSSKNIEICELIQKIGTNRAMAEKKIGFEFIEPYTNLNENRAFGGEKENNVGEKEKEKFAINGCLPAWWDYFGSNH
jgi:hypothetical protein